MYSESISRSSGRSHVLAEPGVLIWHHDGRLLYILALISSSSCCSFSLFTFWDGHPTPRPSVSFGFGIMCTRIGSANACEPSSRPIGHTVNVVDDLVSNPAVVLQDVEVLGAGSKGNLLGYREELGQRVIRNVCELLAVMLGNDELEETKPSTTR